MRNYWIIYFLFFSHFSFSQKFNEKKTNKQLENFAYVDVIETYEGWIAKGKSNTEMFEKLGDAYYFQGNLNKAAVYYQRAYHPKRRMEQNRLFRFYQSLKASDQSDKAQEILKKFHSTYPNDSRGSLNKKGVEMHQNFDIYDLDTLRFNSSFSDYGSFVWNQKLYFTSARDTSGFKRRKHSWTGERFTNLYEVVIYSKDSISKVFQTKVIPQSRLNESSLIFNKKGDRILFTRNNLSGSKKIKGKEGSVNLGIYQIFQKNEIWTKPLPVSFNHPDFQVAHPALDHDEVFLYFVANFEDTKGQSDLYRVAVEVGGNFGKPQNLGSKINTEGRETFPFVYKNQLYFASDGHAGLGGLDVFVSDILPDGTFSNPINLGSKINSRSDDFAIFMQNDSIGFLSSNRIGGKGNDDLYLILKNQPKPCNVWLHLKIKNLLSENEIVLSERAIQYQKDSIWQNLTNKDSLSLLCFSSVKIKINQEGFEPLETVIQLFDKSITEELMLKPISKPWKVGDDLAKLLEIKPIYFDLDQWNIREDAAIELTKVLTVLVEFPQVKIDIRAHTDARANANYNLELSNKRAFSTLQWFVNQGIDSERLSSRGFGESQLINSCADGVNCTEEAHQQNRRSEFIIVE